MYGNTDFNSSLNVLIVNSSIQAFCKSSGTSSFTAGLKSFDAENVVQMEAWGWASPEYSFQDITDKKITKVEIDPSKTLADVNQIDNSFTIE